jgi:hypothetical protein
MRLAISLTFLAAIVSYLMAQSFVPLVLEQIDTQGIPDSKELAASYVDSLFHPMICSIFMLISSSLMAIRAFRTRSYFRGAAFGLLIILAVSIAVICVRDYSAVANGVVINLSLQHTGQAIGRKVFVVRFAAVSSLPSSFDDPFVLRAALMCIQFRILMLLGTFGLCTALALLENKDATSRFRP